MLLKDLKKKKKMLVTLNQLGQSTFWVDRRSTAADLQALGPEGLRERQEVTEASRRQAAWVGAAFYLPPTLFPPVTPGITTPTPREQEGSHGEM